MGVRVSFDVFGLILQAGLIVKLVLLVLFAFSLISWAIILSKWKELRGASEDSEAFLEIYHDRPFDEAYDAARDLGRSPAAAVFVSICDDLGRMARESGRQSVHGIDAEQTRAVHKRLSWLATREAQRLERGLSFLATTGSSAVYIGLFGTVIGIIQAFQGIAQSGNASLAVVAPGIAEALIATAIGLFAAIPATIFYNHFSAGIDKLVDAMEYFAGEFETDVQGLSTEASAVTGAPL
ncbi:MAG: MotA/TolQ/ExbB proton channel family protein [Myxococcota bacterium]|jgi:biopolymer transport protein TolQ|nr:MotA/TolQ/ExbB proton channel family protein [Myxococcota bacterium]